MKILLTTLNAKYVHSNLALRYLAGVCPEEDISIREYTINDRLDLVAGDIFKYGAQVIGFSCYIWNISQTLELIDILTQVSPQTVIVLGGPEVSYDPAEYLRLYPGVDYVVFGEGEKTFAELVGLLRQGPISASGSKHVAHIGAGIAGLAYRGSGGPAVNPARELIKDLAEVPSPYPNAAGMENKIAYVESTRGCPFSCQYCLSSTFQGVRYFPLERTKAELRQLVDAGIKQVKFVDRTFNCSKVHALEIMTFLAGWNPPGVNFHFEMSADLLDGEFLSFLRTVPHGLFQFEVGVQSTNPAALAAIQRHADLAKLEANVKAVAAGGNIAQLLDLIAGLPGEDYQSFASSFNQVYSWRPDKLQLGFLKLLKGSGIRERAGEWGYRFTPGPPYRVLANQCLSYDELLKLQVVEDLVDKFFNSGRFANSLAYLVARFNANPFGFYEALAGYWEEKGYHRLAHNAKTLYELLLEFYRALFPQADLLFSELLKLDYLLWTKPNQRPAWFPPCDLPGFQERADSFFRTGLPRLLPGLQQVSRREINKYFQLEAITPEAADYLKLSVPDIEPVSLLFYYPGPFIKADKPGYIPVVI